MKTIARTLRMTLALLTALAPFHGIPASAQGVPARTHFQGRLTDASNNPLTGPNGFMFAIYDAASGGTLLWTETQPAVPVANGVFAVELGAATPLPSTVFAGSTTYLQVAVNGNAMTPRERLVAVPYSHNTQLLSGREFAAFVSTDATAQNIAGAKAFTGTVIVPAPTAPGHAATKAYVDAAGGMGLLVATNTWSGQNVFLNLISISSDLVITGVLNRGTPLSIGGPLSVASGVTAASGTFTASGAAQFSLQTSSGINVTAGGVYAPFFTGAHYGDGSQLSGLPAGGTDRVLRSGDTMTGQLTVTGSSLTVRSNGAASPFLVSTSPVAGTASLYVDGFGNVGVGTLAPGALLDLQGGAGPLLRMSARKNVGSEPIWDLRGDFNSSGFLTLTGNSVAVMQWGPGGANLGGSIADFPSARLSVVGSAAALPLVLSTGSASSQEVLRVNSIGSVGIGTTSPGTKLHVSSGVLTIDGTGAGLALRDGTQGNAKILTSDASGNATWQAAAGDSSKVDKAGDTMTGQLTIAGSSLTIRSSAAVSPLLVSTSAAPGTASIYVDGTGKVGIGNASPTAQLHVNAPDAAVPALRLTPPQNWGGVNFLDVPNYVKLETFSSGGGVSLQGTGLNTVPSMLVRAPSGGDESLVTNGKVGIGLWDNPDARLHVHWDGTTPTTLAYSLKVTTGSPESVHVAVTTNGNFGIGTTAPSTLFDVNGNAQFGSGVNKSTFSTTGALNLASGAALNAFGPAGVIVGRSSVTASAFFGDGSNLTNLSGTDASRVLKSGDTMSGQLTLAGSTLTVQGNAFSVGNSTLVVTNGNIGIGTTAPASTLHLKANGASLRHEGDMPALLSHNSSASSIPNRRKMHIGWTGGTSFGVEQRTDSEAGLNFRYLTFDLNSGNTGVGTSAANPLAALHADGNTPFIASSAGIELIRVTGTSVTFAGGAVVMRSTAAAGAHAVLRVENNAGAELTRFQQDGRVGVGVTAPAASLHVSSANAVAADTIFQVSSGAAAGQQLLFVKGDGRLGLGTTSNARLHIAAPDSGSPALRIKTPDSFGGVVFLDVPNYGRLETFSSGGGFALQGTGMSFIPSLRVSPPSGGDESLVANGKVGIGLNDNPDARLHVHYDGSVPAALNYNLKVTTGAPETAHFVVTTGGNVGVGTTSPASKFHVIDGDIRVSTSAGQPSKGIVFQDGTVQTTAAGGTGGGWTDTGSVVQLITPTDTIGSTGAGVTVSTHLIVSAGNVGIGTTNPATMLDVNGNAQFGSGAAKSTFTAAGALNLAANAALTLAGASGSINTVSSVTASAFFGDGSQLTSVSGTDITKVTKTGDAMTGPLTMLSASTITVSGNAFSVGGSTLVVTNGYAGIGTASPASKLHMSSGTLTIDGNAATSLTTTGNVGIGTMAPARPLDIYGSGSPLFRLNGPPGAPVGMEFATAEIQKWAWYIPSGGANFSLWHNPAPAQNYLTLDGTTGDIYLAPSSGKVGIGTTSPTNQLTVAGAANPGIDIKQTVGNNWRIYSDGGFAIRDQSNGVDAIRFDQGLGTYLYGAGGAMVLTIPNASRNVGIGTPAPAAALHVSSAATAPATPIFIVSSGTAAGQELLRIQKDGNVGIGTTGPTKRLTVVQADDESFTGLSGAAGNHTAIALGRTASEARLGIAAGAGSYAANSVAGDAILRVDDNTKKLHLLAGTGNAVMTVTGSNVGVGTANPGALLHLQGLSASTTAQIVQRAGAGGTGANLTEWRTEAGGAMAAVDRSGRIIYGGDTALQGAGISLVTGDAAQPGLIVRGLTGQTADLQTWQGAGGAPLAVVTAAGSLGVGTAMPGNKLQVNVANASNDGMTVAAANGSSIFLGPDRGSGGSNALVQTGDASLIFSDGAIDTGNLVIGPWASGAAGVRITSTGNVGIGTTSPGSKLEVAGTIAVKVDDANPASVATGLSLHHGTSGTPASGIGVAIDFTAERSDGNNGYIGSIISSMTQLGVGAEGGDIAILTRNLGVTGERMRITSAGNVGVQTTSPGAALDVGGASSGLVRIGGRGAFFLAAEAACLASGANDRFLVWSAGTAATCATACAAVTCGSAAACVQGWTMWAGTSHYRYANECTAADPSGGQGISGKLCCCTGTGCASDMYR